MYCMFGAVGFLLIAWELECCLSEYKTDIYLVENFRFEKLRTEFHQNRNSMLSFLVW